MLSRDRDRNGGVGSALEVGPSALVRQVENFNHVGWVVEGLYGESDRVATSIALPPFHCSSFLFPLHLIYHKPTYIQKTRTIFTLILARYISNNQQERSFPVFDKDSLHEIQHP